MHRNTSIELQTLVAQIANGSQVAFKCLFTTFYSKLLSFAFSMVKCNNVAAEIVDDVFLKIWQKKGDILAIENITVYLYQAVKNASLNYLKKKHHEIATNPLEFAEIDLTERLMPDTLLITKELAMVINEAIKSLSPKCKMVFKLIKEDGLSYKEVAEIMNISIKTVDNHLYTAIKYIRASIANHQAISVEDILKKNYTLN